MPGVTIVLPVYNGEKYIRESIESIINQTYEDWELIIVDDCSTDLTAQIIREYLVQDKRISLIKNHKNMKLPKSLNIGFDKAKGKYLTWTSDDNMYYDNAIKEMVAFLDNNEYAMVVGNMEMIDEYGKSLGVSYKYKDEELAVKNSVGACFLYKKDVIDKIGKYDEELFLVEDYDYWIRVKQEFGNIAHIDKTLYKYRIHGNSLTAYKVNQINESLLNLREKHMEYILNTVDRNEAYMFYILLENISKGYKNCCINKKIRKKLSMSEPLFSTYDKSEIIVFGCGKIGKEFVETLNSKIRYIVDNNKKLDGMKINGIPVIQFNKMSENDKDIPVVIAVSVENQYDIIKQLWNSGYKNYLIWSDF